MTSVAAIITTHNRAGLLPRAVKSVLAQTRAADEIIIVDDGSTDGTATYLASLPPVCTILNQKNRGISAARNLAIGHANSEWLAFLDDDDEWLPEKLETQLAELDKKPGYRLCHTEEIWIRHRQRVNAMHKHKKHGGWIYPHCLPLCVISPSAVMIHRDLFAAVGLFDTQLPACEDYDLWLRICAYYPVLFIDQALVTKYGGHADQLSHRHWGMDRFRILALEKMTQDSRLSPEYLELTLHMLAEKTTIYIKGAEKRNKVEEIQQLNHKLEQYAKRLARLSQQQAPA